MTTQVIVVAVRMAKWWNWVVLYAGMVVVNLAVSLAYNRFAIHHYVIRDWTAELFGMACGAIIVVVIATWHLRRLHRYGYR